MINFLTNIKNINQGDINEISNFLFYWILFEKEICENEASYTKIKNDYIFKITTTRELDFKNSVDYFLVKYPISTLKNDLFPALSRNLSERRGENEFQELKTIIENYIDTYDCNLELCLRILFRYRNNLFHGEKNILKLSYQKENFEYANKILKTILESFIFNL